MFNKGVCNSLVIQIRAHIQHTRHSGVKEARAKGQWDTHNFPKWLYFHPPEGFDTQLFCTCGRCQPINHSLMQFLLQSSNKHKNYFIYVILLLHYNSAHHSRSTNDRIDLTNWSQVSLQWPLVLPKRQRTSD